MNRTHYVMVPFPSCEHALAAAAIIREKTGLHLKVAASPDLDAVYQQSAPYEDRTKP